MGERRQFFRGFSQQLKTLFFPLPSIAENGLFGKSLKAFHASHQVDFKLKFEVLVVCFGVL
jgi:hypothetical protein